MIQKYINYLSNVRGYSANTASSYEKDLRNFVSWLKKNEPGVRWSLITRTVIDRYVQDMAEKGLKPATSNRRLAAISGIFNYFKREGLLSENPCRYESRRKVAKKMPNTIPTEELKEAYLNTTGVTKLMIGLLTTTGIRVQEMLDLDWSDIDFKSAALRVHGKGGKDRIVYTSEEILTDLANVKKYLQPSGKLFYLTQRDVRYKLYSALKQYSQAKQLSPHAIRHTFATNLAKNEVSATTIQALLGHSDIKTTQRYIDMSQSNTKRAAQTFNILK